MISGSTLVEIGGDCLCEGNEDTLIKDEGGCMLKGAVAEERCSEKKAVKVWRLYKLK